MKIRFSSRFLLLATVVFSVCGLWLAAEEKTAPTPTPVSALAAAPQPVLKVDATAITEGRPANSPVASYADVVEPVQKAVVSVYSTKIVRQRVQIDPLLRQFFGNQLQVPDRESKQEGLGSGVIISPNGYILTNNHVVAGADELNVLLSDGRELKAKVIGTDDKTDIAVIKIEAENLPVVTLADSDKLRVGDIVFAIGNPLGIGQTVTSGIISAKGRNNLGLLDDVAGYEDFLQTDAAINMGNSGGALIDAKGRLVGINSAIISPSSGNIGIGFAIPVNLAASIMHSLLDNHGKVLRGYLGVSGDTLTADVAEAMKLSRNTKGVLLTDVPADGPAGKAGLKRNDVLLAIGDHTLASLQDLRLTVAQMLPGREVDIKVLRDGKEMPIKVSLAQLPEAVVANNELLPGVTVGPVDADTRQRYNIDNRIAGLVITDVAANSPYAGQLVAGVVIVEINQSAAIDAASARKLLRTGRSNLFLVYFRGALRPIAITVR